MSPRGRGGRADRGGDRRRRQPARSPSTSIAARLVGRGRDAPRTRGRCPARWRRTSTRPSPARSAAPTRRRGTTSPSPSPDAAVAACRRRSSRCRSRACAAAPAGVRRRLRRDDADAVLDAPAPQPARSRRGGRHRRRRRRDAEDADARRRCPGRRGRLPVEMGRQRCFVVRPVETTGSTTIEGAPGEPVCVTPVDRFPPAAPERPRRDPRRRRRRSHLDGRRRAGPRRLHRLARRRRGWQLQPLMTSPTPRRAIATRTSRPGVTYAYSVVALDKAGNPSAAVEPADRHGPIVFLCCVCIASITGHAALRRRTRGTLAPRRRRHLRHVHGRPRDRARGRCGCCAPVMPSKIVCVGLNYKDHAAEQNKPLPPEPLLFIKPSTASSARARRSRRRPGPAASITRPSSAW